MHPFSIDKMFISSVRWGESQHCKSFAIHLRSHVFWLWTRAILKIKLERVNCISFSSVGCGLRIHWLHLSRRVPPLNECPGYDNKQLDGEAPVMLELWAMQNIPYLPLLSGPLWPGMVALDRVLSMGQIIKSTNKWYAKLNYLKYNCLII